MKTNFTFRAVSVLCVVAALVLGCGGSDPSPASCDNDADKFTAAMNAYLSDPTKAKCEAMKSAAHGVLDCPGITAGQKTEYENAVNNITCD